MTYFKAIRFIMAVFLPGAIFPVTFYLQLHLGAEASLFPLYVFAIAGLAWELGLYGAVGAVFTASSLWIVSMLKLNEGYANSCIYYYNCLSLSASFLIVAYLVLMFRRVVEQHRGRMETMRATLNVCHGCGAFQDRTGQWIALGDLPAVHSKLSNECPNCRAGISLR
jgi:hypothetical protein